jgi:cation-transporting ATPase I
LAAALGWLIAGRGALVLDRSALRRLDRVDTVVLDGEVLLAGHDGLDELVPIAEADRVEVERLVERAHELLQLSGPRRERGRDGWSLPPLRRVQPVLPASARASVAELGGRSARVLVLCRGADPVALVGVSTLLDPFAESLVGAARRAGSVRIGGSDRLARRLGVEQVVPGGAALAGSVRALQASGRVVAVVSGRDEGALAGADVGIALVGSGRHPCWSAHVLTRSVDELCLLLEAVPAAVGVSARSAQLAVLGSGVGALLAMLGSRSGAIGRANIGVQLAAALGLGHGLWSALALTRRPRPLPAEQRAWHAMPTRTVLQALGTTRTGLGEAEACRRRLQRPGSDEGERLGLARATLQELANPLTPALAGGAAVSAAAGSLIDPLLIATVLVLNGLIGGAQRVRAQHSLGALRQATATLVRVRRRERHTELPAEDLVEGEVIALHAGDAVPADCRVLVEHDLEIDESTLTGESLPVSKTPRATTAGSIAERDSMLYEGTVVASGRTEAVVVATGERTEAGRARQQTTQTAPVTGVQMRLRKLTARILPLSVGAGVGLLAVDVLRRRPVSVALSRAVSLSVAAVPEGLPFVATVAELAAARRLSARGALVRNPSTIEALGRVEVLCFDKTGTLTEGRISLREISDGARTTRLDQPLPDGLADVLALAARACPFHLPSSQVPHQTDRAVLRGAQAVGLFPDPAHVEHLAELPFESRRGYHATAWRDATARRAPTGTRLAVKGAPEVVLPLCRRWRRPSATSPLAEDEREHLLAEVHRLARQGHRVLAVAETTLPPVSETASDLSEASVADLDFRGLIALVDPVRSTAAHAVGTLRAAGVRVMMLTGDHPSTAKSIAAELDALNGRQVLTGAELDELTDDQLCARLADTAVFARVTPAHKARIVRLLQAVGTTVAVTGDGTNDAPAIRAADVGIALGARATPAARECADIVITDGRIETITDALVEGRAMWSSVRDALSILLGGNLGEIAYTLGTGLTNGAAALNARQLLLINLLTDVLPAMAVAVRPPPGISPAQLLAEGPEASLASALTRDIATRAAITAAAAGLAWTTARPVSTPGQASTTGLVALVGAQLGQTLAVRGRTPLVTAAALGSLAVLITTVQTPGLSHLVGSRPLLPHQWAIALTATAAATVTQLLTSSVQGGRTT